MPTGTYKSKIIGVKVSDKQFLKEIGNNDILGIAELHAKISVPGFELLKLKIRGKEYSRHKK